MQGKPISKEVSIDKLAKRTVGFSGADLENMLNEAAILAARANKKEIEEEDLEEASLKVTMGSERKTLQTEEERKMTAYHEAGHALVASNVPDMDPVHQISIVARGSSLGHTAFPPERDRYNETQTRLESMIATMLGGRAAEDIVFSEFTIGASDDIKKATALARKMVTEYGMSELGPVNYNGHKEHGWIARELYDGPEYGEEIASKIDAEVKKIIDMAYGKAKQIIGEKRTALDRVSKALLEKETIRGEEYLALLDA
jgi:cell division protease FtsH